MKATFAASASAVAAAVVAPYACASWQDSSLVAALGRSLVVDLEVVRFAGSPGSVAVEPELVTAVLPQLLRPVPGLPAVDVVPVAAVVHALAAVPAAGSLAPVVGLAELAAAAAVSEPAVVAELQPSDANSAFAANSSG